jgi:hypothetical protein
MKNILKLEELLKFIFSFFLWIYSGFDWWLYFVLLLTPDIGMLGYLAGKRNGAILYNIFHHQGIAIIVGLAGLVFTIPDLVMAGLILFGHSSMDRIFGYGLKYPDDFKSTHLGRIG